MRARSGRSATNSYQCEFAIDRGCAKRITGRPRYALRREKLRESKKTDLFYHLLRNVSLSFLNHAGAQHSCRPLKQTCAYSTIAARTERANARLTTAAAAVPCAPCRA
ncbi:hypothetical protein EVAR_65343_1 [Eumeta japonica]|uniref:Uncharacterized protein n=1 Tax=Eumeta variegata TaxID=151549 RepID=A0A4C1Z674_EUMVA|nr:hypothetical protein EVAR_65343_1 [Eumeta japonica]